MQAQKWCFLMTNPLERITNKKVSLIQAISTRNEVLSFIIDKTSFIVYT